MIRHARELWSRLATGASRPRRPASARSGAVALLCGAVAAILPSAAAACACGCGVFDVGAGSLLSPGSSGVITLEYDLLDQTQNWSGDKRAPGADNPDKRVLTHYIKLDGEYAINRDWSVMVDIPIADRTFRTQGSGRPGVTTVHRTALGDVRVMANYTGLAQDMNTGLTFGLKLPTGDFHAAGLDRDTQIGSGSTDLLIGGYHRGALTRDAAWGYFVQVVAQIPLAQQGGYRPGQEFNGAAGVHYEGLELADGKVRISPLLQVIASVRAADSGLLAERTDSGYERLMLSPGVQVAAGDWRAHADVELPVYQRVNGNQLVAPVQVKVSFSRNF